jgi:hypothetical protein
MAWLRLRALTVAALLVAGAPAGAASSKSALDAANAAFANVSDYRMTIAVHEIAGNNVQDRTYSILFKKPALERVDIVAGAGRGGGIVWLGGDKVKGHRGGLLSGIHLTLDIHDGQVSTLRGDTVSSGTIPAMLAVFDTVKGTVSEVRAGDRWRGKQRGNARRCRPGHLQWGVARSAVSFDGLQFAGPARTLRRNATGQE